MLRSLTVLGMLLLLAACGSTGETSSVPPIKLDVSLEQIIVLGIGIGASSTVINLLWNSFFGGDNEEEPGKISYNLRVTHPTLAGKYLEREMDLPYKPSAGMGLILVDDPEIEALVERVTRHLDSNKDERYVRLSLVHPHQYNQLAKESDWDKS